MDGREQLAEMATTLRMRSFCPLATDECESMEECEEGLAAIAHDARKITERNGPRFLLSWDPFIKDKMDDPDWEFTVCKLCRNEALDLNVMLRNNTWHQLPEIFRISVPNGWDTYP